MINEAFPARMFMQEKLDRLGISKEAFDSYCSLLIKDWSRYRIKKGSSEWLLVKNKNGKPVHLTRDTIAYHLLGKYWISTFAPPSARYLCFDIDPSEEQLRIYREIHDWLVHPIVFQSSERKGLHVYVFLSSASPIRWYKLHQITQFELRKRNIEVKPGICEIPLDPNVSLRTPLGRGSSLLDPKTLAPMNLSLKESINFLSTHTKYFTIKDLFPGLKKENT